MAKEILSPTVNQIFTSLKAKEQELNYWHRSKEIVDEEASEFNENEDDEDDYYVEHF